MQWIKKIIGCMFLLIACQAQAMRCGDQLVYVGDDQYTVLKKCGEPLDKQKTEENVPLYNAAGYQIGYTTNTVERWIYQRSSADFQYVLRFDSGVVKDISASRNP